MQCLNVKNKEVAALLDQYADILGSYNAAYYVLSENNGYGLDKAPNGEPSKLYNDLLSIYNNDHFMAIRAKSMVYSDNFKNWFGDWLSDNKDNVSKVVDENGEPLVVYHGTTTPDITTFDLAKTRSGRAFWFANMEAQKGVFYSNQNNENLIMMPLFVNMRTPLLNDADSMESYATDETHDGGLILGKLKDLGFSEEEYQELLDKGLNDNSYLATGNVKNPNQLKSATDNVGTFSTTNDDIRYSSITEQPIKVPSITSFAERLQVQQQPKFAYLVARGEISTSCR